MDGVVLSTSIVCSQWVVWHNQGSGNRTMTAHIVNDNTYRTLCGRTPAYLVARASLVTPRCSKCAKAKNNLHIRKT